MRAGTMRHRVGISTRTLTVDTFGQQIESFSEPTSVWAEVEEIPSDEAQAYEVTVQKKKINVTIRYKSGVSALDRITYSTNTFNILSVYNIDGSNITLEIVAERIV